MAELALDLGEWDSFVEQLDGVRMPQLVRGEASAHPRLGCGSMQFESSG